MEIRYFRSAELRAEGQGDEMSISGYAARWNKLSEKLGNGTFREMLLPYAFKRSLQDARSDVKCLMNHNPDALLGRQKNGSLQVTEDSVGLRFRCSVADTTTGRDAFRLIQRGDISGCSFAFAIDGADGQNWDDTINDPESGERIALRKITRANLYDVSAVTSPAYSDTDVSADVITELNSSSFPAEIRSRIIAAEHSRTSRKNLLNFILN